MTATRSAAHAALDSERDYQEAKWQGNQLDLGSFIALSDVYLAKARELWAMDKNDEALDFMRKVGGITMNCMEQHGAPMRDMRDLEEAAE